MSLRKILYIAAALAVLIVTINLVERAFRKNEIPERDTEDQRDIAALRSMMNERRIPETNNDDGGGRSPGEKKFIRDIFFEKNEVCLGESLDIRVELQNPDGPVSDLTTRIGGKFGERVILNFEEQGEETVNVIVKDPQGNIDMRRIKITVNDCPGKAAVMVRASRSRNRPDEAEISVVKKRGLECPCTYEWDFGDGTNLRTSDGKAAHNYGNREQDSISSSYVVSVDVIDSKNNRARGRTSLTFPNFQWASKQLGFSIVPIVQETAYALSGSDYEIGVKIKNIYENPIVFDTAAIQARDCTSGEKSSDETVKASAIMKKSEIRAGEISDEIITISRSLVPDSACGVAVMLRGSFPDKTPAAGMIFFLKK